MFRTLVVLLALAPGCGGNAKNTPETPKDATPTPTPTPEPAPAPTPPPAPAMQTPQELYTACQERVEGTEAAGECKADGDCAKAGCGSEVCVSTAEKANVMTTCEDKPCFKVLDACGCHDGKCTWTVKAEMPAPAPGAPAGSLPSSLPPTGPGKAPAPAPK